MDATPPFRRVAVLGTGLIGGSFALALRHHLPDVTVVGFDRAPVLERAVARGAVHEVANDMASAVSGADLVYVAFPVGAAIDALPEKYRAVITLFHLQGKQYEEIASVLGLPMGTVKTHLFRAKEQLRRLLDGMEVTES